MKKTAKRILRVLIPVIIGLGLAGIIIVSYLYLLPAFTAEKAVTGYIKASLRQDASDMVRYASEYQKVKLYGNKKYTNAALREKLEKSYANVDNIYAGSTITFVIESIAEVDSDSEEYQQFAKEYQEVTGNTDFTKIAKIAVKVYVNDRQNQKQTVYAVKSGLGWYYGY